MNCFDCSACFWTPAVFTHSRLKHIVFRCFNWLTFFSVTFSIFSNTFKTTIFSQQLLKKPPGGTGGPGWESQLSTVMTHIIAPFLKLLCSDFICFMTFDFLLFSLRFIICFVFIAFSLFHSLSVFILKHLLYNWSLLLLYYLTTTFDCICVSSQSADAGTYSAVLFLLFQAKRVGLEERAHTIGHTGRSSPVSSAYPPRRTSETMPLPQVSLLCLSSAQAVQTRATAQDVFSIIHRVIKLLTDKQSWIQHNSMYSHLI